MKRILLTGIVMLMLPGGLALAADSDKGGGSSIPPGALYRFTDEDGNTEISSSLPDEAIEQGYEILNRRGRVIKEVAPALTEQERRELRKKKQRQRQRERQKERDERLLRLYAGPEDARRARDRQIKALEVKISYTRNSLQQVKQKLDREVSAAAKFERRGQEVPESIQETIKRFQSRIEEHQREIEGYRKDIEEVREKFQPIIDRLKIIAPDDESGGGTDSATRAKQSDPGDGEAGSLPSPAPTPDE